MTFTLGPREEFPSPLFFVESGVFAGEVDVVLGVVFAVDGEFDTSFEFFFGDEGTVHAA